MTQQDPSIIRIATRASKLAMWQAEHVAEQLRAIAPDRQVELVPLSTIGDRDKTEALTSLGGTGGVGVFTREIQAALLDGRADLAVHSLKDLPTDPVPGLCLAAVPERGAMFDVLVLPESRIVTGMVTLDKSLSTLPRGSRIGSGSPRRKAQLLSRRTDLQFVEARGNVETRLRKLDEGQFDALILAEAGLMRLDLADRISGRLSPPLLLPAVGQGALGIECRVKDDLRKLLDRLTDQPTLFAVVAERTVLATLRAGCHAPLGVWSRQDGPNLRLSAVVLSLDGIRRVEAEFSAAVTSPNEAATLGRAVAEQLLATGASELLLG